MADLAASVRLARQGFTFTLGLRAYFYLALAQYLAGSWDDVLLTADQGFSAAELRDRLYERPLLHLAAGCVPAGRGVTAEAERHAAAADEAVSALDYGQERLYAGMLQALRCQASADYAGMANALDHWQDESRLDGRSQVYGVLWRPLLVEGLLGAGRIDEAEAMLEQLRRRSGQARYLRPGLAWLTGWLAEQRGDLGAAPASYESAQEPNDGDSPVYRARLLLAHGRLLRRVGERREAIECLRRSDAIFAQLEAVPFRARTSEELAAAGLPRAPDRTRGATHLTGREAEVAHLVGRGLTNAEVAAELYVTPKAVAYHLTNIYAKLGVVGRRELRRSQVMTSSSGTGGSL